MIWCNDLTVMTAVSWGICWQQNWVRWQWHCLICSDSMHARLKWWILVGKKMLQYTIAVRNGVDETTQGQQSTVGQWGPVKTQVRNWKVAVAHAILKTRHFAGSSWPSKAHEAWRQESHGCNIAMHVVSQMHKRCRSVPETREKVGRGWQFPIQDQQKVWFRLC